MDLSSRLGRRVDIKLDKDGCDVQRRTRRLRSDRLAEYVIPSHLVGVVDCVLAWCEVCPSLDGDGNGKDLFQQTRFSVVQGPGVIRIRFYVERVT